MKLMTLETEFCSSHLRDCLLKKRNSVALCSLQTRDLLSRWHSNYHKIAILRVLNLKNSQTNYLVYALVDYRLYFVFRKLR